MYYPCIFQPRFPMTPLQLYILKYGINNARYSIVFVLNRLKIELNCYVQNV